MLTSIQLAALRAGQRTHLSVMLVKCFDYLHTGSLPLAINWHHRAICHALEETFAGRKSRLVITVPPRHLKSTTAAVAYVAWALGHDPARKIMVASYSQDLARLHAEMTRRVMESDWYKELFPNTRISDRGNRALELVTTMGGGRKAVSVGGSVTGFGAEEIIVDDCMKADEVRSQARRDEVKDWFKSALYTRLNDKAAGRIVSIQQRVHEDDLPNMLIEQGFEQLNLPAIAEKDEFIPIGPRQVHHRRVGDVLDPNRESLEVLEQIRRDLGPAVFSAQYQQQPIAPDGNLLHMEWFGTYDEDHPREAFLKIVQSWDTGMTSAPTSDYSVCTIWGFRPNKWYLLDVYRQRLDYPDLKRAVIRLKRQWQADIVLVERAGSGISLWQDLRASGPFKPFLWDVAGSKEDRFIGCLGEIESGNILLPVEAPWLEAFKSELRAFPSGRYDDQVDSMTQFIGYQRRNWKWVLTEFLPSGRPANVVRLQKRPW